MAIEPRYHTAEHLQSAAFEELFEGIIVDTRFKGKKVRCDYKVKLDIPLEEAAKKIENRVNQLITDDLPVTYETVTREQAEEMMVLRKVPHDMDPIRLVKIGDYDVTPCSGEHVKSTSEIGRFESRTIHQLDDDTIRITFMLF